MRNESHSSDKGSVTRRAFLRIAGAASLAISAPGWLVSAAKRSNGNATPVVSFHMDRPYLDWSGTAVPYLPPPGARSARFVAHLSEEGLRRQYCYL